MSHSLRKLSWECHSRTGQTFRRGEVCSPEGGENRETLVPRHQKVPLRQLQLGFSSKIHHRFIASSGWLFFVRSPTADLQISPGSLWKKAVRSSQGLKLAAQGLDVFANFSPGGAGGSWNPLGNWGRSFEMFMFVYDCLCVQMWMLFSSWLFDNVYAFRTIQNHLRKTSWFTVQEDRSIDEVRVSHIGKAILLNSHCQVRGFGLASNDLRQFTKGQAPPGCGHTGCLIQVAAFIRVSVTTRIVGVAVYLF